jgi:hypothetical protein
MRRRNPILRTLEGEDHLVKGTGPGGGITVRDWGKITIGVSLGPLLRVRGNGSSLAEATELRAIRRMYPPRNTVRHPPRLGSLQGLNTE